MVAYRGRLGGGPFRSAPQLYEAPISSDQPRPNKPDTRTHEPLGGKDDGEPTKPTKHSVSNSTTSLDPNRPSTYRPQQDTLNATQDIQLLLPK